MGSSKTAQGVWSSAEGAKLSESQRTAARSVFRQHEMFSVLTDEQMEQLLDQVRVFKQEPDSTLYRQYDYADSFFLLAEGQMKLTVESADGKEKVVEIVTAGKTIAEQVMFMPERFYPLTAQAIDRATLYCISREGCIQLLQDNTDFSGRFLSKLSLRVDERLQEMLALTQQPAAFRVARFLMNLLPEDASDGHVITLNTPKQVIASKLSIKPETFSRVMATLSQKEIISVRGREICVKDIEGLCQHK